MDDLTQMRLTSSSCAKVFIQRDYSDGVGVKFETKLPNELQGKIDSSEFEQVIERVNSIYADAESLSPRTYMENCFACLTAYLILLCMKTNYEKNVRKASEYIINQNDRLFIPKGLLMIDPMERGLRVIEICIINEPVQTTAPGSNGTTNANAMVRGVAAGGVNSTKII